MIRILYLIFFLISTSIFSQADLEVNKQNKERFISFVSSLTPAQLAELKIQLMQAVLVLYV